MILCLLGLAMAGGGYFLVKWSAKMQKDLIEKQKHEKDDGNKN